MGHTPIIPTWAGRFTAVPEWSADVTVDEALVRRLLAAQFPEFAVAPLRPLAEGWDNAVWLVDERWAFRFPHRTMGAELLERELRVLPRLAAALPAPIPAPVFVGHPDGGYPWMFFGAELIPGVEPLGLDDGARCRLAPQLARFLRALHDIPVIDELANDPNRRADMPYRAAMTADWLERLGHRPAVVEQVLSEAQALPPPEGDVVAHGDLHFRHVLVDGGGALAGVIDWGDVCRADPSIDLSLLWSFFPADGRAAFLAAYGPVSDAQLLRARALAVNLCAVLAVYGHEQRMSGVEREALEGLDRCLS
jgi:aminoglycoside phosphotransferase (APT) family kinase protein